MDETSAQRTLAPEAELSLLLAGVRARRTSCRDRIAELASLVDEQELAAFLARQRLLLLVATRLGEAAPDAPGAAFAEHIATARARAHVRAELFLAATEHLVATLEARGIRALVLKGPVLAEELYGDPALRAYDDIDVLVMPDDLAEAVQVARSIGWTQGGPAAHDGALPQLHHHLRHDTGALPVLELHWRIHWYETDFASAMLARARRTEEGSRTPRPADQFAALLLFYARDGFAGLRHASDVAAWWDLAGSPERLAELDGLAHEHPSLAEPWRAALAAAAHVTGVPAAQFPPGLLASTRRSRLACRLANWDLRGDDDQIKANVTLIDGLLTSPRDLGGFVGRHVLPPAEYLEGAYGEPAGTRARAAAWRGKHAVKTLGRYGLAFGRLRRERSWSPLPALPS